MIRTHARPRQTNGQTDEHHGNSATIRSNESIALNMSPFVDEIYKVAVGRTHGQSGNILLMPPASMGRALKVWPIAKLIGLS